MRWNKIKTNQRSILFIPVFLVVTLFLLYLSTVSPTEIDKVFAISNNSYDNKNNDKLIAQNATLGFGKYNFIAVGDYYCNKETKKTIKEILAINPEVIITTGDHVKNAKSADCWKKISKPIKDKMRIAIGNHDAEYSRIYKEITDYHNLQSPYYSHDLNNIHFISMSTEHPYEKASKQYSFIKNDLEDASKNKNIDWIVVHNHKPLYSTNQDKDLAKELRDIYHKLFQQYNVDLVISSHNQYYERTYPILFNDKELKKDKKDIEPIIATKNKSEYPPTDGIIFLTVGTAGDKLDKVKENPDYYVIQESEYGFLNVKLDNNGKKLVGEFHTNKGEILDTFILNET
ncbi:MAG: metallophosphoesterase [Nitrososphaeraceae archaeon]|nr:metallophosphoesterase [Nitrososphaeraceae archaeon]